MASIKTFSVANTLNFDYRDLTSPISTSLPGTVVSQYWDGSIAPEDRSFEFALLWSDDFLYARFEARQSEQLVVSQRPQTDRKTLGLWDRDVCEIFIAPDRAEPRRYFEFEAAPTGEWVDLAIDLTSGKRATETSYSSGMECCSRVEEGLVRTMIRIPWEAFGKRPKTGDVWMGNLFRCVGRDPDRGYLAWSPTMTAVPNFHVPDRFGEFKFVDQV